MGSAVSSHGSQRGSSRRHSIDSLRNFFSSSKKLLDHDEAKHSNPVHRSHESEENVVSTEGIEPKSTDCMASDNFAGRKFIESSREKRRKSQDGLAIVNNFVILGELGRGSTAKVKLCRDLESGNLYAMKVVKKRLYSRSQGGCLSKKGNFWSHRGLRHEIAIMKKLDHPNVLKLYQVIDDPDSHKLYLILEYIQGGTILKDFDSTDSKVDPVNPKLLGAYFLQVLKGLKYLHANNILHGDLKPSNILVAHDQPFCFICSKSNCTSQHNEVQDFGEILSGTVKICDFGVSEVMTSDQDDTIEQSYTTPMFMAPELHLGKLHASGKMADIWSLGVTLYAMTFGVLPFQGTTLCELSDNITTKKVNFPCDVNNDLQDVILSLLDKCPESRITTVEASRHPWCKKQLGQLRGYVERVSNEKEAKLSQQGNITQPVSQVNDTTNDSHSAKFGESPQTDTLLGSPVSKSIVVTQADVDHAIVDINRLKAVVKIQTTMAKRLLSARTAIHKKRTGKLEPGNEDGYHGTGALFQVVDSVLNPASVLDSRGGTASGVITPSKRPANICTNLSTNADTSLLVEYSNKFKDAIENAERDGLKEVPFAIELGGREVKPNNFRSPSFAVRRMLVSSPQHGDASETELLNMRVVHQAATGTNGGGVSMMGYRLNQSNDKHHDEVCKTHKQVKPSKQELPKNSRSNSSNSSGSTDYSDAEDPFANSDSEGNKSTSTIGERSNSKHCKTSNTASSPVTSDSESEGMSDFGSIDGELQRLDELDNESFNQVLESHLGNVEYQVAYTQALKRILPLNRGGVLLASSGQCFNTESSFAFKCTPLVNSTSGSYQGVSKDSTCNSLCVGSNNEVGLKFVTIGLQNTRKYMEDRNFADPSLVQRNAKGSRFEASQSGHVETVFSVFGVLDGHGGAECADALSQTLASYIKDGIESALDTVVEEQKCNNHGNDAVLNLATIPTITSAKLASAVTDSFKEADAEFLGEADKNDILCGACAVVAVIQSSKVPGTSHHEPWKLKRQLTVANVGDCRAVLCRSGDAVQLTIDHDPNNSDEVTRIEAMGGRVISNRVQGVLAVSRAFGDVEYKSVRSGAWGMCESKTSDGPHTKVGSSKGKDIVTSEPDVYSTALHDFDEFLVLASDGLFHGLSNKKVVDYIRKQLCLGVDMSSVCEALAKEATKLSAKGDNTTITIILFTESEVVQHTWAANDEGYLVANGKMKQGSVLHRYNTARPPPRSARRASITGYTSSRDLTREMSNNSMVESYSLDDTDTVPVVASSDAQTGPIVADDPTGQRVANSYSQTGQLARNKKDQTEPPNARKSSTSSTGQHRRGRERRRSEIYLGNYDM